MIQTTDSSGAEKQGTPITGATMPSGGKGSVGWLSAIWKAITDRLPSALVSGRLDVNVGNTPTVVANAGTGPFPVSDNAGSLTVDAPVGTPVFVRLSDGTTAIATLPVSGPLTDAQLRATAVPVSGPLTDTQLRATAVPVSGPLTDTQLRASAVAVSDGSSSLTVDAPVGTPVFVRLSDGTAAIATLPVSGPLTDAQLRASAISVQGSRANAGTDTTSGKTHISVGGSDGTNLRILSTDSSGRPNVNINGSVPVTGTFWQTTQPISAASLPLPTGAATETTLSSLNGKLPAAATLGDGAASVNVSGIAAYPMLWCGSYGQYSRAVNHDTVTLLTSAARTTTTFSADQLNRGHRGIIVFIETTIAPGGGIGVTIQGRNPLTGTWVILNYNTLTITTGVGVFGYELSPGASGGDNFSLGNIALRVGGTLPLEWRIRVGHATSNSYTYSVAAQLLR